MVAKCLEQLDTYSMLHQVSVPLLSALCQVTAILLEERIFLKRKMFNLPPPSFTEGKTEAQRSDEMSKVTQQVSAGL